MALAPAESEAGYLARLRGIAAKNTDRLVRLAGDVVDLHQMRRGRLHLRLDKITLPEIAGERAVAANDDAAANEDDELAKLVRPAEGTVAKGT